MNNNNLYFLRRKRRKKNPPSVFYFIWFYLSFPFLIFFYARQIKCIRIGKKTDLVRTCVKQTHAHAHTSLDDIKSVCKVPKISCHTKFFSASVQHHHHHDHKHRTFTWTKTEKKAQIIIIIYMVKSWFVLHFCLSNSFA